MSNNNKAPEKDKTYCDPEAAKDLSFEELTEITKKIINENTFLAEEVSIFESFLGKNAAIVGNIPTIGTPQTRSMVDGDESMSESDASSVTSASNAPSTERNTRKATRANARKKKQQESQPTIVSLPTENKLEIATNEIDDLRTAIEKENKAYEKKIEEMRAEIKEADMEIEEVDKDHNEFQK